MTPGRVLPSTGTNSEVAGRGFDTTRMTIPPPQQQPAGRKLPVAFLPKSMGSTFLMSSPMCSNVDGSIVQKLLTRYSSAQGNSTLLSPADEHPRNSSPPPISSPLWRKLNTPWMWADVGKKGSNGKPSCAGPCYRRYAITLWEDSCYCRSSARVSESLCSQR